MVQKRSLHISVFGSRVTSVVSVALVLVLLGMAAVLTVAAHKVTDRVRQDMGFTVKMEHDAPDRAINDIKKLLTDAPFAESFVFAGADEILALETEIIGEDIVSLVDENPYSAEFDVKVRTRWANSDSINSVSKQILKQRGVEEIITDSSVIDNLNANIARLTWIMLAIALALLVISFVLINNTVSLAVYSRRFIIHTMRLVGAKGSFIRRPFLAAGAMTGFAASIAAIAILAIIQAYAIRIDPVLAGTMCWHTSTLIYILLTIAGIGICLVAAAFATNRYLRSNIDEYYMN